MRTLVLKIDEGIYANVVNFLKLLPKNQCSIIEKQPTQTIESSLNITSSFGLLSTPITATLDELKESVIQGAIDDDSY